MVLAAGGMPARAVDGMFVDGGGVDKPSGWWVQAGARWDWGWRHVLSDSLQVGGYWQLSAGTIGWNDANGNATHAFDIGFTPVFAFEWDRKFVLEGGVGFHLIANRPPSRLGTAFEFGDMAGVGYRVSPQWLIGYRILHFSNAGIRQPNGGVNTHSLHMDYSF
jgi:lipid A 3-O-deacylase